VFDTSVKLVRGKYADSSWIAGFYPDRRESYITEGTPRQYTFYVPHNIPDLAQLMGGVQSLESSLDTLFAQQQYWHGNEPGHQIPFLYNYTAAPWKTQAVVHKILKEEYDQGPGGLSGNDDAGQMSAWYIFGALGFYPVNPVSDKYMLSSPLFRNIRLKTSEGKYFKVVSHATSSKAIYIQHVKWQGKPYLLNYITHDMIRSGGTLELWLQESPGNWGSQLSERDPGMQ
jgi:predicted alpha-1,2-mannosidase